MPPTDTAALGTIIANAGKVPYPIPRGRTSKLDSVEFGSEEFLYMLATFCFDAHRKLLYLCKATLPIHDQADEEFIEQADQDSQDIKNEANWEGRARRAEQIMIRLQRELENHFPEPQAATSSY